MKEVTQPFKYTSLHHYLDLVLGKYNGNASDKRIKQAKAEYRKLYLAWHKSEYKKEHGQIQLTMTKKRKQEIVDRAKTNGKKVQRYIMELINQSLSASIGVDLEYLKMSVSYLRDLIDDFVYEHGDQNMKPILKQLEEVEQIVEAS